MVKVSTFVLLVFFFASLLGSPLSDDTTLSESSESSEQDNQLRPQGIHSSWTEPLCGLSPGASLQLRVQGWPVLFVAVGLAIVLVIGEKAAFSGYGMAVDILLACSAIFNVIPLTMLQPAVHPSARSGLSTAACNVGMINGVFGLAMGIFVWFLATCKITTLAFSFGLMSAELFLVGLSIALTKSLIDHGLESPPVTINDDL